MSPRPRGSARRSQSAPTSLPSQVEIATLRRRGTGRFDALHTALVQVNSDGSQIPVEDILQATRLVHEIGTALNEKMSRKLEERV